MENTNETFTVNVTQLNAKAFVTVIEGVELQVTEQDGIYMVVIISINDGVQCYGTDVTVEYTGMKKFNCTVEGYKTNVKLEGGLDKGFTTTSEHQVAIAAAITAERYILG